MVLARGKLKFSTREPLKHLDSYIIRTFTVEKFLTSKQNAAFSFSELVTINYPFSTYIILIPFILLYFVSFGTF